MNNAQSFRDSELIRLLETPRSLSEYILKQIVKYSVLYTSLPSEWWVKNSHFAVYKNQTRKHIKNRNQQSFLQVSLSSIYCAKAKKSNPSSLELTEGQRYKIIHTRFITLKSHQILTYLILCYFCTLSKYKFLCWQYQTHKKQPKTTENKLDLECTLRTRRAPFCVSSQSPPRQFSTSLWSPNPWPPCTAVCEGTSLVTPDFIFFFFQVFAKNILLKNIFEEEKNFDSRTWFFLENSSVLGVFWPRRGLQANRGTVRKSAIFPQPDDQKRLKWSNTAYANKKSFTVKKKILCLSSNQDLILYEGNSDF